MKLHKWNDVKRSSSTRAKNVKELTDTEIVEIIREEWNTKVAALLENVNVSFEGDIEGSKQPIISAELKLIHKKSGLKYTVDSVSQYDVVLRTPEGKKFRIDRDELENEYFLD